MRLDLHIHTTASDGAWTPEAVVAEAARAGLDVIAIADHDTVDGVAPALRASEGLPLDVVPAVELSTTHEGRELHVLGYFVDPGAPELERHAERAVELRRNRMRDMVARLRAQGMDVTMEAVDAAARMHTGALARPHLARVLVEAGYASSVGDAFNRLIGDHHEAFVPTGLQTPAEAIALIHRVGGLAVWAHPPIESVHALLPELIEAGLDGLEVFRPPWKRTDTQALEELCAAHGLLKSGGSDWHTPDSGRALGEFHVSGREIEDLLEAGGL